MRANDGHRRVGGVKYDRGQPPLERIPGGLVLLHSFFGHQAGEVDASQVDAVILRPTVSEVYELTLL